jgi:FtsP/CotA-like multicopper oxidase with cupredoxin domain
MVQKTMPLGFSRRSWLQAAGLGSVVGGVTAFLRSRVAGQELTGATETYAHRGHALGVVGRVSTEVFDPSVFMRSWNFSNLPAAERSRFYRETPRGDGTLLREYEIFAVDREIEIAPGLFFPAWTFNGTVPGPTIRATEGDRVRVHFVNQGTHPHTIHFHGWHEPAMDGSLPEHQVMPGDSFVYEFDADPYGLHLYHCHSAPLKRHIHKGLYGAFIVDPKVPRPPADEFVMIMNAFDTNFDIENEVYAINTVAHHHMHDPVPATVGRLVRLYLINVTEFDLVNSLHLHGMFFDVFRTGTSLVPSERTDTIMMCQGERAILETTFRYPGDFMFHAHQSEFAELGWMGLFRASGGRRDT